MVHHGALGSFAAVYGPEATIDEAAERLLELDQVAEVLSRRETGEWHELPEDRIGDLTVISVRDFTLGTHEDEHDLSGLGEPLRSHGGISEQKVPLIVNRPIDGDALGERRLRNFDAFDLALNHVSE